ncbi:MAG: patatin-like phospholipase family protein [Clostridia bacterium]|nr:patatin-like phospholipase family protein [Clostridia bacterium]
MKIGIALAGGGIRGVAHAGVLKALEDNNINIDIIGGTSAGSIVASLYAMGYEPYYIYNLIKRYAKQITGINTKFIVDGIGKIINKKVYSSKRGTAIEDIFNELARRKGIENLRDIKMPLVIPTIEISEAKEYIFTNYVPREKRKNVDELQFERKSENIVYGKKEEILKKEVQRYISDISVGKAVRASSSFPAFFSPCEYNKCVFMDGGVINNVPVEEVKKQGADKVIAVKFHAEKIDRNSNTMDIIMKTIDIMGSKISEDNLNMADIVLNVYTDKVGLLDTKKLDKCFNYGYECVVQNLDKITSIIENNN